MKKILLTIVAAMGMAATANAQLANGAVFPDFTVTDINGMSHNLYTDLAAGKTVFIDISATWCNPCWNYHQTGALDSIWSKHGPAGAPGVDATTTNDVVVYFFQGETTSGMAELTANTIGTGATVTTNETPAATVTQGNWVLGTNYYIVDDSSGQAAYNTAWNINFFPTVYMICRDRLVTNLDQPTEPEAYAAAQATCPTTPPASGSSVDAKAVPYQGSDYFVCNGTPSVTFQNYSTTANITSATITVQDASGATVATAPWSGTLAPYATQNVSVPSFAGTSFGGYKYTVTVGGDVNTANDVSLDSAFKIYTPASASALPGGEDFEGSSISYKESFESPDGNIAIGYFSGQVGATGSTGPSAFIVREAYSNPGVNETFVLGNFNTVGASHLKIQFDVAYEQASASSTDALAVKISTDCGSTWSTLWTQSGATLATGPVNNSSEFYPTSATQWKHVITPVTGTLNANTMVKFENTTGGGNDMYIDNVVIGSTTGVAELATSSEISVYPNPANDVANVSLTVQEAGNVHIEIIDALGRTLNTTDQEATAGYQTIQLSTASLSTGIYNVRIVAGGTMVVKKLSVAR